MSNRLSHSQINRYLTCQESYRLHYKEHYRPLEVSSALIFGSALGKAFEYILNPESNQVPNLATPTEVFDYHFLYQNINDVLTNVKEYEHVAYSKYDMDKDLGDTPYESLRVKGHLMIHTFINDFLPLVEKVWSTEEKVELANEEGDSSIGYADAVLSIKGYDKPIIIDFKSAARAYEEDSAKHSVQLSQYLHVLSSKYENTRYVGYVVFLKNISKNRTKVCSKCSFDGSGSKFKTCNNEIDGKRCNSEWDEVLKPKAEMQIIIDQIPETFEYFVVDNIAAVNDSIKTGIYVKNINSCRDNGFGRSCEFIDLCWNGKTEGLTKVQEKNK